jgi:hypothetical protein
MPFPEHIGALLDRFGVSGDTKSALYDLYLALGSSVVAAFGDLVDRVGDPGKVRPEDLSGLKGEVIRRYLETSHEKWLNGEATASLWHPREAEGRAAGLVVPLGRLGQGRQGELAADLEVHLRKVIGTAQPIPEGILLLGRNAHFGGRTDTLSFDIVTEDLQGALEVAGAEGRQHTIPGSVGESSATADISQRVGLIWEVQPNVLKPSAERNRQIRELYRRHRNWHLATLTAAILWMRNHALEIFIVRGQGLATTHQVNDAKPVGPDIVALHDRTVQRVVSSMGMSLRPAAADDSLLLLPTDVMNTALRKHVLERGGEEVLWHVEPAN